MAQTAGSPIGLLLALTYATGSGGGNTGTPMWTKQPKVKTKWVKLKYEKGN